MQRKPKEKLKKYKAFTLSLLPHEMDYLVGQQRFADSEKTEILRKTIESVKSPEKEIEFDLSIDKRKYSYIKSWIENKLKERDADEFFQWIHKIDYRITTDSITRDDELEINKIIKKFTAQKFYFMRFYEVILLYQNFLLIRMRYNFLPPVTKFINKFKDQYQKAKGVYFMLNEATNDIVEQYNSNKVDSLQWEQKLIDTFKDKQIDGFNRYYAIVRLTFIYYNYHNFYKLTSLYDELDKLIVKGKIYSKRILVNYYANRLLIHSRFNELDKAAYYGYLSIRIKSSDYLFYVNNLCAILLRRDKFQEALSLMKSNLPEFRNTNSSHNQIGFVSYYVKCLNKNNKAQKAFDFAKHYLQTNKNDILKFRWRIFFLSLFESCLLLEKYDEIIKLTKKYQLQKREAEYSSRRGYLPTLVWYEQIAKYKEMKVNKVKFIEILKNSVNNLKIDGFKFMQFRQLCEDTVFHISDLQSEINEIFSSYKLPTEDDKETHLV